MSTLPNNGPAPGGERRRATRYRVAVEGMFDGGTGRIRDISAAGVYFTTTETLAPGASLVFQVEAKQFKMASPMKVRCRCRVVRIESQGGHQGVAAAIDDIELDGSAQDTGAETPPSSQNTPLSRT